MNNPENSELEVFRIFTARLVAVQKQPDPKYHDDAFLRDKLLTAIDRPHIRPSLRERIPDNSQQALNRVASHLSERPNTSDIANVNLASTSCDMDKINSQSSGEDSPQACYSLGQNYGVRARNTLNPYPKASNNRRPTGNSRHQNQCGPRRVSPEWFRVVKGCFICGKPRGSGDRHPRAEVSSAIRKLKDKHPQEMLTVEDLAYPYESAYLSDADGHGSDHDMEVWVDALNY